ncbi:unnamed protein product [Blepharisma stoltei]|uniref:Uncharacterized protein n=1 Tax=Blepharisma stoltei TaxID=1481888 RepID=A0AAU9JCV0_9CILI|nr:unnamed protein product [Blepharisma stoltei]
MPCRRGEFCFSPKVFLSLPGGPNRFCLAHGLISSGPSGNSAGAGSNLGADPLDMWFGSEIQIDNLDINDSKNHLNFFLWKKIYYYKNLVKKGLKKII